MESGESIADRNRIVRCSRDIHATIDEPVINIKTHGYESQTRDGGAHRGVIELYVVLKLVFEEWLARNLAMRNISYLIVPISLMIVLRFFVSS